MSNENAIPETSDAARAAAEWPLWSLITAKPSRIDAAVLGETRAHISQVRVLVRGKSRIAAARALVNAGVAHSLRRADKELLDYGSVTRNERELAAVTDEHVYISALDGNGPIIRLLDRTVAS